MGTLVEIIALAKEIPENHLEEALEKFREAKDKADSEGVEMPKSSCPHCGSREIVGTFALFFRAVSLQFVRP
jgi:hypothetical protein